MCSDGQGKSDVCLGHPRRHIYRWLELWEPNPGGGPRWTWLGNQLPVGGPGLGVGELAEGTGHCQPSDFY